MNAIKHHKRIVVTAVAILLLLIDFILLFCISPSSVYAEISGTSYSNVIDDLKSDADFNISLYPANKNDYSLQVIQVAESEDKELFVYVYQPSNGAKDYTSSSINISTAINDSLYYKNYKLELLSRDGVFCKYRVKDFVVKDDVLRYYDISSIFRPYDKDTDEGLPETNENEITEVAFKVAKRYTAVTLEGKVTYSCIESHVIEITDKYVGYIKYSNGFDLCASSCLAYYVAFDTDLPIDNLYEADIDFVTKDYSYYYRVPNLAQGDKGEETMTYDDPVENTLTLNYDTVVEHEGGGLFAKKYTWERIAKVDEFIANEKLTDEGLEDLENKSWVLRFYEADLSFVQNSNSFREESTKVSDVTILRLKFETDGKVYNLGVVDNKQSPGEGQLPDNENTNEWELPSFDDYDWEKILGIILFVIGLILIVVLLGPILPYIIRLVIWIILLPFKFIAVVIKSIAKAIEKSRKRRIK